MARASQACRTAFPPGVCERIGSYVYVLLDPRSQRPFYVGKGCGNRVFAHARAALRSPTKSDKLGRIREIHRASQAVGVQIVRHGLDERTALEVEAATIDVLAAHLTNEVAGHGHERCLMSLDELVERHGARPLQLRGPALLIRIARQWTRGMPEAELYEATRKWWRISPRRAAKARHILAVADGIVRQVYEEVTWRRSRATTSRLRGRWMFTGWPATGCVGWIGRSVVHHLPAGNQNPIRYVCC
jgi:hypothetical protein